MAFQPWKPETINGQASIQITTFNGAMAFQPWKHTNYSDDIRSQWHLQWGHGLSAMETTAHH